MRSAYLSKADIREQPGDPTAAVRRSRQAPNCIYPCDLCTDSSVSSDYACGLRVDLLYMSTHDNLHRCYNGIKYLGGVLSHGLVNAAPQS